MLNEDSVTESNISLPSIIIFFNNTTIFQLNIIQCSHLHTKWFPQGTFQFWLATKAFSYTFKIMKSTAPTATRWILSKLQPSEFLYSSTKWGNSRTAIVKYLSHRTLLHSEKLSGSQKSLSLQRLYLLIFVTYQWKYIALKIFINPLKIIINPC